MKWSSENWEQFWNECYCFGLLEYKRNEHSGLTSEELIVWQNKILGRYYYLFDGLEEQRKYLSWYGDQGHYHHYKTIDHNFNCPVCGQVATREISGFTQQVTYIDILKPLSLLHGNEYSFCNECDEYLPIRDHPILYASLDEQVIYILTKKINSYDKHKNQQRYGLKKRLNPSVFRIKGR